MVKPEIKTFLYLCDTMMGKTILLNVHYRAQLMVGLILGLWLYFFLVLVGPYDAADLSVNIRVILMLGYGMLFFLSYALLIPIQNKLFHHRGTWKLGYELAMVVFFCLYCLPVSYAYYKTEIVNGTLRFEDFALNNYLPIISLVIPVIFLGRYLIARQDEVGNIDVKKEEMLTLLGDNKLDILKLAMTDLVAFEAANNYVVVYYLLGGKLQKKLLRSSLRKIHKTVPQMIQVHRSYLVNLQHFVEWKDGLTLVLTQLNVPISQKYKSTLLAMPTFAPN